MSTIDLLTLFINRQYHHKYNLDRHYYRHYHNSNIFLKILNTEKILLFEKHRLDTFYQHRYFNRQYHQKYNLDHHYYCHYHNCNIFKDFKC